MSVKGQHAVQQSGSPRTHAFHEVLQRERGKLPDSEIAEKARMPLSRVRELVNGKALPTRREFKRLGHAIPGITYKFDASLLEAPTALADLDATGIEPENDEDEMAQPRPEAVVSAPAPPLDVSPTQVVRIARLGRMSMDIVTAENGGKVLSFLRACERAGIALQDVIAMLGDEEA